MKISKVFTSYNETISFMKKIDLLKKENYTRNFTLDFSKFSSEFVQTFQKKDYVKTYMIAMENNDYDILLKDDSFFQFTYDNSDIKIIRYAYYENPFKYKTYEEFIFSELGSLSEDEGDLFLPEYEQYISESSIKLSINPMRFDYDGNDEHYKEMLHTGSHIHIGHNNEIRLPSKYLLTPLGFVIFVLRNQYLTYYKELLQEEKLKNIILKEKKAFSKCPTILFKEDDESQLYFS